MDTKQGKRQRIKRAELVRYVFSMFAQRYEQTSVDSIHDISIPVAEIRKQLSELFETTYQNDWWILTQLHRYERETGTRLFERVDSAGDTDEIILAIYQGIEGFRDTHHLFTNQKLRIAEGVLDLITHTSEGRQIPLSLFLGSGSIPATIADVLVHTVRENGGTYRVFSHNLAVQEKVLSAAIGSRMIDFFAVGGRIDHTRYISLTDGITDHIDQALGFVVQSTNTIDGGLLYVEDSDEARMKSSILHDLPGVKILALMKDEFMRPTAGKCAYGRLTDYDYIVTIPSKNGTTRQADRFFDDRSDTYIPYVAHWSYTIYRVSPYPIETRSSYTTETEKPVPVLAI